MTFTPSVVETMLAGLTDEWTRHNEGPDTWSPYDIVGHFIHGEKTDWIPRMKVILAGGGDRRFVPFDRFAQFEDSPGKTLTELLAEFKHLRRDCLTQLAHAGITDKQLDLTGVHPEFGSYTLRQLLAAWVVHDLGHIAQIARVAAKQYKADIGPWIPYLPVVTR